LYAFTLSLDNPTKVDYLTDYTTADQVAAATRGAETHHTPMIAQFNFDPDSQRFATHPGHSNLDPFLAYVRAHYCRTKIFPNIEVWSEARSKHQVPRIIPSTSCRPAARYVSQDRSSRQLRQARCHHVVGIR
jgi:hypothetical protein